MPVPDIVNRTYANVTSASSITLDIPDNIWDNDLLIALLANEDTSNSGPVWDSPPTGWSIIDRDGNGQIDVHNAIFYKICDGTESNSTVTFTWNGAGSSDDAVGFILQIHGHHLTSPIGADVNKTLQIAAYASDNPPGISVTGVSADTGLNNNQDILGIAFTSIDHGLGEPYFRSTTSAWKRDTIISDGGVADGWAKIQSSSAVDHNALRAQNSSNSVYAGFTSADYANATSGTEDITWAYFSFFGSSEESNGAYAAIFSVNSRAAAAPTARTIALDQYQPTRYNEVRFYFTPDDNANPRETYSVEISTDNTNWSPVTEAAPFSSFIRWQKYGDAASSQPYNIKVNGLTQGQQYYFRLKNSNSQGTATSNVITGSPAYYGASSTFEGGTDGQDAVTNAPSSPSNAFTTATARSPTTFTANYDTSTVKNGSTALELHVPNQGNGFDGGYVGWHLNEERYSLNEPFDTYAVRQYIYARAYFYIGSIPSSNDNLDLFRFLGDGGSDSIRISLDASTGYLSIRDTNEPVPSLTGSTAVSTGQWVRIETKVQFSYSKGSNDVWVRLYNNADSTTFSESFDTTSLISPVSKAYLACGAFYVGVSGSNITTWFDDVVVRDGGDDDWIGPASTSSTSFQGKLGDLTVSKMYLGDTEVTGGYLGDIDLWA
jgi:hypothetical protein